MNTDPSGLTGQNHTERNPPPPGRVSEAVAGTIVPIPTNAITTNQNEPLTDEFGNAIVVSEGGPSPA